VWRDQSFTLTGHGAAEQVHGAGMSHDLFEVLRVAPLMGRTFTATEDQPGGPPVLLISQGFWRRWFNGRSDVIGQTVEVNGVACEVIGVMPAHFTFAPPVAFEGVPAPKVNELWTPLATNLPAGQRGAHYLLALGRLAPGITAQAAEQELIGIAAQLAREHPDSNKEWSARIVSFSRQVTGDQRPALLALSIAVSLVLLLACANVAWPEVWADVAKWPFGSRSARRAPESRANSSPKASSFRPSVHSPAFSSPPGWCERFARSVVRCSPDSTR
jgi:hypothetical protein